MKWFASTVFTLCVDYFGVKYSTTEDANHFIFALTRNYRISVNLKGDNYLGLTLKWDYTNGYVDLSMPGYIKNTQLQAVNKGYNIINKTGVYRSNGSVSVPCYVSVPCFVLVSVRTRLVLLPNALVSLLV